MTKKLKRRSPGSTKSILEKVANIFPNGRVLWTVRNCNQSSGDGSFLRTKCLIVVSLFQFKIFNFQFPISPLILLPQ